MIRPLAYALLAIACLAEPALAQNANPASVATPGFRPGGSRAGPGPRSNAPPALPGARAEPTEVIPPSKSVTDMPPTEALFDAINRGDLPSAKDAVGRGAELNGTNVLGLTPIELAVDLGRNQISFYLLSLRGGIAGSSARGPGAEAKPPTRAERLAADKAERAQRLAAKPGRGAPSGPAAPQYAKLFAGGGGSPIPQAGFLGFDAGR